MTDESKQLWAIVELFGHARIAGQISEHTSGGSGRLRPQILAQATALWPELASAPPPAAC
jgi:hypothetical protein